MGSIAEPRKHSTPLAFLSTLCRSLHRYVVQEPSHNKEYRHFVSDLFATTLGPNHEGKKTLIDSQYTPLAKRCFRSYSWKAEC